MNKRKNPKFEDDYRDMVRQQKTSRKEKKKAQRRDDKNYLKSMDYSNLHDEEWEDFEERQNW